MQDEKYKPVIALLVVNPGFEYYDFHSMAPPSPIMTVAAT
jgi:hypothetical protein